MLLVILGIVTAVVGEYSEAAISENINYEETAETQELQANYYNPFNAENTKVKQLNVENLFGDKDDSVITEATRSRRSCDDDGTNGLRSLVIVFDITGSMGTELAQLQKDAKLIVDEITTMIDNPIYNYVLVPFDDPSIGPRLVTRNKDDFVQALTNLKLTGGGDCPELAMGGILQALEVALPYSTIYVFTDADAKDVALYPSVLRLVEEKKTPIVIFRTGVCSDKDAAGQKALDDIAAASKGRVYDIARDQVGQVFLNSTRTMLATKIGPPGVSVNLTNVELLEGDDLELSCLAESQSSMLVQWKQRDRILVEQKFDSTDTLLLKIANVTTEHSGWYVCRANNSAGEGQHVAELRVKPAFITVGLKNVVVFEHTRLVSLFCITKNVKAEAHKAWIHNGVEITSARGHEYLNLFNLTTTDEGIYECRVEINGRFIADSTNLTVETTPKVTLNANDTVSSAYGKPLTLDCGIDGNPKPNISWSYRPLGNSEEKEHLSNETSLQLPSVTPEIEGFYICEGINSHGRVRRSILIQSEAKEPPRIFKSLKDTIYVPSGGRALLHCSCSHCRPLTEYIWTNGHLQFANTSYDVQDNARVNLTIDQTRKVVHYHLTIDDFSSANEGNYSCILSNTKGTDSLVLQVLLIKEPKVNEISVDEEPQKAEFIGLSDSVHNLTCNAVGVPDPEISWMVNGKTVDNNSRYKLQNDNRTLTLVDGFDADYTGTYKCIAANLFGTTEAELSLKYGMFPQLTKIPRSVVNVEVGQLLELTCEAEGIPAPDVKWYTNGQPLGKKFPFEANLNDSGVYECVADNKYGHIAVNSTVKVHAKPELVLQQSSEITTIAVAPGNDIALECIVSGYPKPTVSWTFENRSTDELTNVQRTPTGIKILKISSSNQGSYVCNAKNLGGIVQKVYNLVVQEPPKVVSSTTPKEEMLTNHHRRGFFVPSFGQVLGTSVALSPSDTAAYRYVERYPYTNVGYGLPVFVHVPARWSPWSEWSTCSATCGTGFQSRSRVCSQPSGSSAYRNHDYCEGESFQVKHCDMILCAINGGWGSWSDWSNCSRDCVNEYAPEEKSTRSRSRRCDSPVPSHDGKPCEGEHYEDESCSVPLCHVDGGWTSWSQWSPCSETCGFGKTIRWRTCGNPAPRNGGLPCQGSEAEIKVCKEQECIVDGGWSEWNPWSRCSNSSGTDVRTRTRFCNNPKPKNGGRRCVGLNMEQEKCSTINETMLKSLSPEKSYRVLVKVINSTQNEVVNTSKPSSCEIGMEYNDTLQNCVDVNECATKQHMCTAPGQICLNKNGGYDCDCAAGYRAIGTECVDIDECREGSRCSHFCLNTVGRYTCSCPVGYTLSSDDRTCVKLRIRQ